LEGWGKGEGGRGLQFTVYRDFSPSTVNSPVNRNGPKAQLMYIGFEKEKILEICEIINLGIELNE